MNKELTCIIVDDESVSRETLKNYVEKYCDGVNVLELCENVEQGLAAIKKHNPDIVFLDIEMPYGDGFDLLDRVDEISFEVVFITAFSNYAIKALNMSATYYILKPIDIDELVEAVKKIREKKDPSGSNTKVLMKNLHAANPLSQQVVLPQLTGFMVVQVKDILRAEADNNYTTIFMTDGSKHVVSKTLKFFDELLNEAGFVRIHQSHLVNVQQIAEYKKGKTGQVKLSDGTWLDISPQRKKDFLDLFKG